MMALVIMFFLFKFACAIISLEGDFWHCAVKDYIDLNQKCSEAAEAAECQATLNSLLDFSTANDNEFQFFSIHGEKKPFYTEDGMVHETKCKPVKSVSLHDATTDCRKDLSVNYTNSEGTASNGYLSKFGFLKPHSAKILCDGSVDQVFSFGKTEVIRRGNALVKHVLEQSKKQIALFESGSWFLSKIKEFQNNPIYEILRDIIGCLIGVAFILYIFYHRVIYFNNF
jgi:hypothetical protein